MEQDPNLRTHAPRDLFLAWLFGLPDDVDVTGAALSEIARIDSIASPSDELRLLRGLFHQAVAAQAYLPSRRNTRRH